MSPLPHTTRFFASTTTACTRWRDSTRSPRVATTSRSSCITNRRLLGNDRGASHREDNTAQHERAADERERRRHFANAGDERRDERGADGFAERRHVHHVRGQVLEGPIEAGVTEEHGTGGERDEDRELAARLRHERRARGDANA